MFVDARTVAPGETLRADVCVVGAGAAGIALARELGAGGRTRVALLESGGLTYDAATQELYEGELAGVPYFPLETARLRFFGGTTNHWSGLCRPFDKVDFEPRPWVPNSGWPIRREDLDPYYGPAAELLGLPSPEFSLDYWRGRSRREPLPVADPVRTRPAQIVPTGNLRLGQRYREELEQAGSIATYLHANVLSFETDEAGAAVTHVRVATLEGREFTLAARTFVLAAGGIENPRLLLASDTRHPSGLGNEHDLVGRFFLEHPRFRAATLVAADGRLPLGFYEPHGVGAATLQGYLALTEEAKRGEGLVDVQIRVEPEHLESFRRARDSRAVRSARALPRSLRDRAGVDELGRHVARVAADLGTWGRFTVPGSPLPVPHPDVVARLARSSRVDRAALLPALLGDVTAQVYATASGSVPIRSAALRTRIESVPNPDSRVTLVRERDALGMRRVELDWRLHELDLRSAVRAVELLGAALGRAGLGRLRLDVDPAATAPPDDVAGGWHHMGTTRMSDDPRRGVVDRDCRVHGLANLYVAGSSVFPTAGSGTPTLTIVALALRLAEHLRRELA